MDCIFCKIVKKEIPAKIVYEDDQVMIFPDLHPMTPVHLLAIPKKHVKELFRVEEAKLFSDLFSAVQKMIKEFKLEDKGYRVVINGGGAQDVHHLHVHLRGPISSSKE